MRRGSGIEGSISSYLSVQILAGMSDAPGYLSGTVADPDRLARFVHEARAASALNHPWASSTAISSPRT